MGAVVARRGSKKNSIDARTESYSHPDATLIARPEAGQQSRFKKKKPKATYRYDSSLAPEMNWDGQNPAREHGEWLIACIEDAAKLADSKPPFTFSEPRHFASADGRITATVTGLADATEQLKRLSQPYLDWSGKAERLSFDVPTLPLFVHERLSTQAIIETLKSHRKDAAQSSMFDLFGDPQRPLADAITKAYEHQDKWVNRLILGDSLVVMNSLLQYEGMGGQVQMIYIDPPYGVNFGSNFQPFVRKRDVAPSNDDADMTREPEMVKAYRDTWDIGLHSYLSYLRDRLTLSRNLLTQSGSIFVQINDSNVHHVRKLMDEIFGPENFVVSIFLRKKGSQRGNEIRPINDHLIWFAKDKSQIKQRFLYDSKLDPDELSDNFDYIELPSGEIEPSGKYETAELLSLIEAGAKLYTPEPLTSGGEFKTQLYPVEFQGRTFRPPANNCWKFNETGMNRIKSEGRLHVGRDQIRFKKYHTDFPYRSLNNLWADLAGARDRLYVVQTAVKAVQRCILMTTDPGDLVLDPTCGSGTTAYVAEAWGRRWITTDVSRVPLALARQRLLTATFPFFLLKNQTGGPAQGFQYQDRESTLNPESIGPGIVKHITSTSVANDQAPEFEVLVDRPEIERGTVRVTGPFCVEATIPTPLDLDGDGEPDDGSDMEERTSFVERMLDTLRRVGVLQLAGNRSVTLRNIRLPAKTLALSAEAMVDGMGEKPTLADVVTAADEANGAALPLTQQSVAIVFGPENGAVSERLVYEAAQEAAAKRYSHLYVIGFSIQPNAEQMIGQCEAIFDVPATWVPVTPDVVMGDLLKTTRASQIFSIAGRPEVEPIKLPPEKPDEPLRWQIKMGGLNTFDPVTMEVSRLRGDDVPCWMLDTNYNGRVFMAAQVFFPRTKAWDGLKKALKATHEESVWDHLAGDTSAPFEAGEHNTIAVKVIDDRGNELMVVQKLDED